MRPLRVPTLALIALVAGVVAWVVIGVLDGRGSTTLPVPWTAPAALAVLAAAVVASGWPVRRWNAGHRDRPLDALRAARTVVLARAAAITGAALVGFYAAFVLVLVPTADIEARRGRLVLAAVAALTAVALAVAGVVVERWCRLPPSDRDEHSGAGPGTGSRA